MAKGVNKVILVGNIGQDPEVKHTQSGSCICSISVATSESWKDKQTGQQNERTEWHRVVFFNRLGEVAGEYLRKGSKVYIEGSLRTNKWQDQQGQDRYTTEVIASEMQMLDSKGDGPAAGGTPQSAPQAQNTVYGQQTAPQQAPRQAPPQQQAPSGYGQQQAPVPQQAPGGSVTSALGHLATAGNDVDPFEEEDIPF